MPNPRNIRVGYRKLIGFLAELPTQGGVEERDLGLYNRIVEELERDTEKKYNEFKLKPDAGDTYIMAVSVRTTVSTLIHAINAEFQIEKVTPTFGGTPGTVINNHQEVSVEVIQSLVLDIQYQLVAKEGDYKEGSPEKTFITRVKEGLKSVKSVAELMTLIMATGQSVGLGIDQLATLFTPR